MKASLALIILLSSLSFRAAACPFESLTVGVFDFPPLYYQDHQHQVQGTLVSALNRIGQETGCSFDYQFYNSVEGLANGLLARRADLMISIKHPIFGQKMHYGSLPLLNIKLALYHPSDSPAATSVAQLNNRKLIVLKGYGYGGLAEQIQDPANNIQFIVAKDHREAVKLLVDKKADYLLNYQGPISTVFSQLAIDNISSTQWAEESAYFITAVDNQQGSRAIEFLEQHWKAEYVK